ncbi:hypothetical protein JCM14076_00570 [Methylosoma difficile]
MNNSDKNAESAETIVPLVQRLRCSLAQSGLRRERDQVQELAAELGVEVLDCAAALLRLLTPPAEPVVQTLPSNPPVNKAAIRMVRYRLDVGSKHQLNIETLKKVLVEESGVDKNNINNVNIHGLYTLIELPDAMPPDIFQHLKLVEINQRKLDIRRVKNRNNKRRGYPQGRRDKSRSPKNPSLQTAIEPSSSEAV